MRFAAWCQTDVEPILMWVICTGSFASRPMRSTSSNESNVRLASSRTWLM